MKHQVGALARCLLCDSYMMVVIDMLEFADSSKKGNQSRTEWLEALQAELSRAQYTLHPCPSCTELVSGQRWGQWLDSKDEPTISVVQWVCFEGLREDLPVYVNRRPADVKPNWVLGQGVGPKSVELDNSRSGRLHKPAMAQFGIANCRQAPGSLVEDCTGDVAENINGALAAVRERVQQAADPGALLEKLFERCCPLLQVWLEKGASGVQERLETAAQSDAASGQGPAQTSSSKASSSHSNGGAGEQDVAAGDRKLTAREKDLRRRTDKQDKRKQQRAEAKEGRSLL